MRKFQFDYDPSNDDLFIYRKDSKSEGGVEVGRVLLDFNRKDGLVGIEFMHATDFLASSTRLTKKTIRSMLRSLKECKVGVEVWRNAITTIKVLLVAEKEQVMWNFSVPRVSEESSVMARMGVS